MAYTSKRKRARMRRKLYIRIASYVVPLVFVVGLFEWGMWHDAMRIDRVVVEGVQGLQADQVAEFAMDSIAPKSIMLIPSDHAWFYSRSKFKQALRDRFERIETITIDTKGLSEIHVLITERPERYLYCHSGQCRFLDGQGLVFDRFDGDRQDVQLRIFDRQGDSLAPGDELLPAEQFEALNTFLNFLQQQGLSFVQIDILDYGSVAARMRGGGTLLFQIEDNYESTYSHFVGLLEASGEFAIGENGLVQDFDYINLRYMNEHYGYKVYYCLVGEECEGNYN